MDNKLYLELGAKDNISPVIDKLLKDSEQLQTNFDNFKTATIKDIVLDADGALSKIRKQIQDTLGAEPFTIDIKAQAVDVDTSRITDAVKAILDAQERLAQMATSATPGASTPDIGSTATANTNAAQQDAEAVNQQAKAYEELKAQVDAVLGSMEKNTATIVEQRAAIALIDKEIKAINKSVDKAGQMTDTQRKRLEMLTLSREKHKQALNESMIVLRNDIKLSQAADSSMNELSQSLGRMRTAYRAMTAIQRESDFGKELLASIQSADRKIKELDASIGNHQRNVGNYGSAFNGLNMSVQQVVRELPSATMGLQMFFLAISNNLPILADQIKMTKEANKAAKEMGQQTTPVWKQLMKSLVSWQTLMIVGITLLTVYGKEIAEWAKQLFAGQRAAISLSEATEKVNEQLEKNDGRFSDNAMKVKQLADEWKNLKTEAEKTTWIEQNQSAFDAMGLAIRDVTSAEKAFVEYTPVVIEALKSRARAEAARELAKEKYKKAFVKREEARQQKDAGPSYWDFARGTVLTMNGTPTGGVTMAQGVTAPGMAKELQKDRVQDLTDEAETLEKEVDVYYDIAKLEDEKAKAELKRLGLLNEQGKTAKEQLQAQKANLQAQLDVLSEEEAAGEKGEAIREKIAALDKKLAAYSVTKTNQNENAANRAAAAAERERIRQAEAAEKIAGIITRQTAEAERAAIDMAFSTRAAEIGAMEDSTEKVLLQIRLDEEKKLEAIRREYEDLKLKRIEEAKKLWDADLTNKGSNFYESEEYKYAASNDRYSQGEKENRKARENEVAAATKRATDKALQDRRKLMNDYLREYGTMQQQREAINNEYNAKIDKATSEWQKASLRAERDRRIGEIDLKALQQEIDWEDVFGDIEKHSVKYLTTVKNKLRAALSAKDITAENAKILAEKIGEIESTIAGKKSIWQALLPGLRERKKLSEQTAVAEESWLKSLEDQAKAINKVVETKKAIKAELDKLDIRDALGQKITVELEAISEENKEMLLSSLDKSSDLYKGLLRLFEQLAADSSAADKSAETASKRKTAKEEQWEKLKNMNSVSDLFSFASGNPLEIIEGVSKNVQSFGEFVDELGLGETDFGDAVHNFADGCNAFTSAINDLASGNVMGAVNDVLKGVSSWAKVIYSGGNDREMEEEIAELAESNERLAAAIDSLSDRIKNSDATNRESEEAYREALKAEKDWESNQRKAIDDRASEWTNTGYGFLGLGGKSSFNANAPGASWAGWNEFNKILQAHGSNSRVYSAGAMWNLTPEEMKLLRDFAPNEWRQLFNTDGHKNPEDLVNAYIERAGTITELTSALNEKLTGYSWDNFKGSFVDTLKDLSSTTQDFADNIEQMLSNAILNSLVNEVYKDRISALYKMIADAASDESAGGSTFTKEELDAIREMNEALANDLVNARNALKDSGVLKENGSSSSRGTVMGATITENTASLLASYINAMRADLSMQQGKFDIILQAVQQYFPQNLTIQTAQLKELQAIAGNTAATAENTRRLKDLADDVHGLKTNTWKVPIK